MNFGIIFDAYKNSDAVGQIIVDVLLLGSLFIWYIIVMKCAQCWNVRKACKQLMQKMASLGTMQHRILGELERDMQIEGPLAEMGRIATNALLEILHPSPQDRYAMLNTGTLPRTLTTEEIERIQVAMEGELNKQQNALEEHLTIMGSIITLAPMLGLFGTVWGVMATFIGIVNNGGRPDIQAIAPGISGALLTTVGGLFVSIPAIFVNNLVVSSIQATDKDMEDFQSLILTSLQLAKTNVKAAGNPVQSAAEPQPAVQPQQPMYTPVASQQSYTPPVNPQPQQPMYTPPAVNSQPMYTPPAVSQQSRQPQSVYPQMSMQQPTSSQINPNYQSPAQETVFSVTQNPTQNP